MKSNKRVLISASGSSIGLEVARSLQEADGDETLIGTEVSDWGETLSGRFCDTVVRLPRGDDPSYREALLECIGQHEIDLAFINTEPEIEAIAPFRDEMPIPLSTPRGDFLEACLSKQWLHDQLAGTELTARTLEIKREDDIERALSELGSPVWIRCATGPRGRGSIRVDRAEDGWFWIQYWRRREAGDDCWLAHEYLPGRNLNWTSTWHEGRLVVSTTGECLKYFLADVAVSGITGNVSHARLVPGGPANDAARQAVGQIPGSATGILSVDLREDADGNPRLTEINGRNAFRPLLYTRGGVNFPRIYVDLMLYDRLPELPETDAGKAGWEIIRGMDFEPLFVPPAS